MKRLIFAGLLAIIVAACQPADRDGDEASPTLDTVESGAPLDGVGPDETQDEVDDEGQ